MSRRSPVAYYATIVAIGGFVFGFDAAVIGGVVGHVASQFDLDPWQIGMVVSAPMLAAIGASLTVGAISDAIGRKKILLFLAALYFVSALLSAVATGFWFLVIARAIGGYAFGALAQAPVYIAEISPPKSRGRMVAINQMTIVVGLSAAYFSNLAIQTQAAGLPFFADEPWRLMLGVEALPALIWLIGLLTIPESPRWLATQGRWQEVEQTLANLQPKKQVAEMITEIKADVGESVRPLFERLQLLFHRSIWYALLIGLILAVFQQITGINTVFFYAATVFEQSGVGTNAAFAQAVLVGLTNIAFTLIAMALIDRLGRKPLMIIGLTGVFLSLSIVAWGFHSAHYVLDQSDLDALATTHSLFDLSALEGLVFESDIAFKRQVTEIIGADALRDNEAAFLAAGMVGNPQLILFGILFFVASFSLSLGPVMWVYLAEIFPNHVRGVAISFVTVFNSGASWAVQFVFPIQLATTGIAGVFAGYGAAALLGLILVTWLMPETKGLTLETITQNMASRFAKKAPAHG